MRSIAVLSMHTSPLAQPGSGDGGGMNVYVRELSTALARSGVRCEVFTRAEHPAQRPAVAVEPNLTVHHVPAGPVGPLPKEQLVGVVGAWSDGVAARLARLSVDGVRMDAIHANYWLSGLAGHALKHELDVPLVATFHTLDRVKAEASPEEISAAEPARRAVAEQEVVGCSDLVLASCTVEAEQLTDLYAADAARIEIVAPGVDHAIFAPGARAQARRAIDFPGDDPCILFVGRIQPLKGLTVAVEALARLVRRPGLARTTLLVVGGPSGPHGDDELARVRQAIERAGLHDRVRVVAPQRHEMLSTYYRAADVAVVPSRSESFGLVALEAAACGLPVVASAVGGLTTLVDHGRTGYLMESRHGGEYADALGRVLTDDALAGSLSQRAAARAAGYTWTDAADRLGRRIDSLTARELVACR